MSTPLDLALAPLKNSIKESVTAGLNATIARTYAKLEANNWDREAAFPYPSGHLSRANYKMALSALGFAKGWTVRGTDEEMCAAAKAAGTHFGSWKAPSPCHPIPAAELVEKVERMAEKEANAALASYVAKMTNKVAEHFPNKVLVAATFHGNNPWTSSTLSLTFDDQTTGALTTKMILNVSPLGTVFNQFPTRKVG